MWELVTKLGWWLYAGRTYVLFFLSCKHTFIVFLKEHVKICSQF